MVMHLADAVVPNANPLIPPLPELIIGAIAFLVVFGILGRVLMPRIQKTLAERTDKIEGGLQRAENAQAEAGAHPGAVPGAAERRPAGGGPASGRKPPSRAPRSSPRCATRPRPRRAA